MSHALKITDIKVGDTVIADAGFTCLRPGPHKVCAGATGSLFLRCADGAHLLDGQVDNTGTLIGLTAPPPEPCVRKTWYGKEVRFVDVPRYTLYGGVYDKPNIVHKDDVVGMYHSLASCQRAVDERELAWWVIAVDGVAKYKSGPWASTPDTLTEDVQRERDQATAAARGMASDDLSGAVYDELREGIKLPFGWKLTFKLDARADRGYLQIVCDDAKCNVTGEKLAESWKGRKWYLSAHMTKSEVVQTAFKAVLTAVEHEVREMFLYKGRAIFAPHYDIDKLWELRGTPNALSVRASKKE